MSFIRIRRGRYVYRETRYRENGRVRSRSEYLGTVGGYSAFEEEQHRHYESAMREAARMDAWQLATYGQTGAQRAERETNETQFDQSSFLEATAEPSDDSSEDGDAAMDDES